MIIGQKELIADLRKMSLMDMHRAAAQGIKLVQEEAKARCPENHGELRDSIYTDVKYSANHVTATCYTHKPYAPHVEFGTGPVGQTHHEGVSPDSTGAYVQHGWGIPADAVSPADAQRYKWQKHIYNGKEYYMTYGQAAQPFMYPALKNNEKKIENIFRRAVKE